MRRSWSRPVGLVLGVVADAVLGDPRRGHPVAGFGRCAAALERRWYADRRGAGIAHTAVLVAAAAGVGVLVERGGRRRPLVATVGTAACTWAVLGGASLAGHGAALAAELSTAGLSPVGSRPPRSSPDGSSPAELGPSELCPAELGPSELSAANLSPAKLEAARRRMPTLCGRDPALLDAAGMARAGTESMAENTSDAVVAPLLWGAVAGAPGLLGYRAVNTLDAMVGYRSARYRRFGWAAARLDDLVNLVPSRVTALLFAALSPAVSGSPAAALAAWRRDGSAHPSPNAGPVEAAVAGGLGVTLGGRTVYSHGVEQRPRLGSGPPPGPADLARAARLARLVSAAAGVLAAALAIGIAGLRRK